MSLKDRFLFALRWKPVPVICGILGLVILILALSWWGISTALDPYDCRMADGVTVGGLDVSGMTRAEARNALKSALEESLYAKDLSVQLPEETFILSPADSGIRVSIRKALKAAYSFGRDESRTSPEISLIPFLQLKEADIRSKLTAYAAQWDTELRQPQWVLTGEAPQLSTDAYDSESSRQTLQLTKGIPALHMNIDQVYAEIVSAYADAISLCEAGDFSVRPEVIPQQLPEELDLEAISQEISLPAVDDMLDMTAYTFVHGSYGYGFDMKEARSRLEEAPYGETVSIPMVISEPEILGEAVYFRDLLGSCETKHTTDENRNTNLRLLCEALNGVILQPGEEFSYNGTVGERTEERGYKAANAYSGTRLVKDIGGGVCQGSTTLYNCALLADLEILQRVCHGAKVSYVPLGLDAAVNWATKTDLRFKNNFHFPIQLRAEVSDGYVKMQILGTDEKDYYIEMKSSVSHEEKATYAVSYKYKYDKKTGELLSKDLEARSAYYELKS